MRRGRRLPGQNKISHTNGMEHGHTSINKTLQSSVKLHTPTRREDWTAEKREFEPTGHTSDLHKTEMSQGFVDKTITMEVYTWHLLAQSQPGKYILNIPFRQR